MKRKGLPLRVRLAMAMSSDSVPDQTDNVCDASVAHDEWCRKLRNGGECNCDPDITLLIDGRKFDVSLTGRVVEVVGVE